MREAQRLATPCGRAGARRTDAARRARAASRRAERDRPAAAARSSRSSRTARCGTGARSTRWCDGSRRSRSRIRRCTASSPSRSISSAHARAAVRRRRSRGERAAASGASRGEGARQRAAAPLSARARALLRRPCARILSRAGRIRAGGSSACSANSRPTGRTCSPPGNAHAPLALRVNRRVATRDALLAQFARRGGQRDAGGRARASSSIRR